MLNFWRTTTRLAPLISYPRGHNRPSILFKQLPLLATQIHDRPYLILDARSISIRHNRSDNQDKYKALNLYKGSTNFGDENKYIHEYLHDRPPRPGTIDQELLNRLFNIIVDRKGSFVLKNLEDRIFKALDHDVTIEDLAIISLAYFKTKTPISQKRILKKLIKALSNVLPTIDLMKPGLCSVIKSLRYSNNDLELRDDVIDLVRKIRLHFNTEQIAANGFNMCQLLKLMESYRIYDEEFLSAICDYTFGNLDRLRIKDIQYIMTSLSNFRYDYNEDKAVIKDELRQKFDNLSSVIISESRNDLYKQSYHLLPILRAFAIYGYYNENLIRYTNRLFSIPSEASKMLRVLESERTILLIKNCLMIETTGIELVLPPRILDQVNHKLQETAYINRLDIKNPHQDDDQTEHSRMKNFKMSDAVFKLSKSLSSSPLLSKSCYKFQFQYTLPHQNYSDMIISKDVDPPGDYDMRTLLPKSVPRGEKHCLLLVSRPFDHIDNGERLSGYKLLMTRILKKIGYIPILVDPSGSSIEQLASQVSRELDR